MHRDDAVCMLILLAVVGTICIVLGFWSALR